MARPLCPAAGGEDCYCSRTVDHHGDHVCTCGCSWENGND